MACRALEDYYVNQLYLVFLILFICIFFDLLQSLPLGSKIPYVLLLYEAEDFCNLVAKKELLENVYRVRDEYPSYTMCYLTNKLLSYVNKKCV